jgi:hypothetical protein
VVPPLFVATFKKDIFIPRSNLQANEEKVRQDSLIYSEIISEISSQEERQQKEQEDELILGQISNFSK